MLSTPHTIMIRAIEKLLTFKPNAQNHGALRGRTQERVRFGREFSLQLDGVWLPQSSAITALFIHGNRHNITRFGDHYDLFAALGISCFAFDFPGYGNSSGVPSEAALYASARAAYAWLRYECDVPASSLVIYGCSLGGAVAIELARTHSAACLITESAFTNSHDMARHLYPLLPIQRLLPKRFQNDTKVKGIKLPHLILHGGRDPLVPVRMAQTLYEMASEPRRLVIVPDATHTDTLTVGGPELRASISSFIESSTARS